MARVTVRKDDLDRVVETAKRAAKRTNSVVVVREERLDVSNDEPDEILPPNASKVAVFN